MKKIPRAFSFVDRQNQSLVGVEWQGKPYNFTLAWELFKQITMDNEGPSFQFLQLVIEMDLFYAETFDELFETLQKYRPIDDLLLDKDARIRAPIERPQKIIGVGRNYREHAKELQNPIPEEPVLFAKVPSTIAASGDLIRLPEGVGRVDYEGELAVVISREASGITANEALEYVAGYTLINDVTARDLQKSNKAKGLPWFLAKNFDTFLPMGPYLIPANAIDDPQDLELQARVNGEIRQKGNTSEMIFSIADLISHISKSITLTAGDVIATGTPSGVGALQKRDTVEVEIEGFGVLSNNVL